MPVVWFVSEICYLRCVLVVHLQHITWGWSQLSSCKSQFHFLQPRALPFLSGWYPRGVRRLGLLAACMAFPHSVSCGVVTAAIPLEASKIPAAQRSPIWYVKELFCCTRLRAVHSPGMLTLSSLVSTDSLLHRLA